MVIKGIQKLTLLDFPGQTACTIFTGGCNLRCPFCHNASLVTHIDDNIIPLEDFFRFLQSRKNLLDGVAITGGEPLMQQNIEEFIKDVKAMGFKVKLDTNGTFPDRLKSILENHLVDYIAVDIKNSPQSYAKTVGVENFDMSPILESINLLMTHDTDFEFRTTVCKELFTKEDFEGIGKLIKGDEKYFLQAFKDSGDIIGSGFTAPNPMEMEEFAQIVKKYVPKVKMRGV